MIKTILILTSLLCLSFSEHKDSTLFIGQIIVDSDDLYDSSELFIEFKVDTQVITRDILQQNGSFAIRADKNIEFDIYCSGSGVRQVYLQTVKPTNENKVLLNIKIPKDYAMHGNKAICPKCNEYDQTIPVVYGLRSIVVYKKDPPPYTTYEGYGRKEVYNGGCVTSVFSPKFYCKRDKLKF